MKRHSILCLMNAIIFMAIAMSACGARGESPEPVNLWAEEPLVDSLGSIFLNVGSTDPALVTGFFLLLTLLLPVFNVLIVKIWDRDADAEVGVTQAKKTTCSVAKLSVVPRLSWKRAG